MPPFHCVVASSVTGKMDRWSRKENVLMATVKTRVKAAPFCLSFGPKIAGAAYTRDHSFQRK